MFAFSPQIDTADSYCSSCFGGLFFCSKAALPPGPQPALHAHLASVTCVSRGSPRLIFPLCLLISEEHSKDVWFAVLELGYLALIDLIYRDNRQVKLRGHPSHYYCRHHHNVITVINSSNVSCPSCLHCVDWKITPGPQPPEGGSNISPKSGVAVFACSQGRRSSVASVPVRSAALSSLSVCRWVLKLGRFGFLPRDVHCGCQGHRWRHRTFGSCRQRKLCRPLF